MYGGFGAAVLGVLAFIGSTGGSVESDTGMLGFGVAAVGMACFMGGMFLSDAGKTAKDFKKERKAGKTTCYACGTKRRLEQPCPDSGASRPNRSDCSISWAEPWRLNCGAPPSSSV